MKKNYILSIHVGHDASAALIENGKVLAAVAEERFTKLKHYSYLPIRSIAYCLKSEKITMNDVSKIVIPSIGKQPDLEVLLGIKENVSVRRDNPNKNVNFSDLFRYFLVDVLRHLNLWTPVEPPHYVDTYKYKGEVIHVEHHLAHAASAYYTSGFKEKTLVVTSDGSGDGLSTTIWIGENNTLIPKLKLDRSSSLGAFYGLVTEALGWWVGDGEGKTMGLAPYGTTKKTKGVLDPFLPQYKNGYLIKGYNWGFPGMWADLGGAHWHFKDTPKIVKLVKKYGAENIAAEAQRVLEEQLLNLVIPWVERENVSYVAAAGGVFLNVKANQRIWETGKLKDFHVYPDAGDAGITVGAGLYTDLKDKKEIPPRISHMYFGPSFTDKEIEEILRVRQISYTVLNREELIKEVSTLLAKDKIIGWFQGRMEAGPRALGNRSILMSPKRAENKDIINSRVKYREGFRPFCPSMTEEGAKKYLATTYRNASFMIISFDVPKDAQKDIAAVVHVDGTARPQVVRRSQNPLYYDLIAAFGKLTDVPVLLNTSFNIKGDPVTCTPQDAIMAFYNTGLDYLVLGSYLIEK